MLFYSNRSINHLLCKAFKRGDFMKELTRCFLMLHTVLTLIIGLSMWLVLKVIIPEMIVKGFITIPSFFYLFGLIFIYCFKHFAKESTAYLVNLYLFMKVIKMFTFSVIIFIYWIIHSQGLRNFIIIFIIFYLTSMIWETHIYLRMEKYIKCKHII